MKTPEVQECQKKRWEECGWNKRPPGMPELQPGRDCRDLLPMCVNSGMSPHCRLKLLPSPTHLQETSPHRRKKNIIYHVFCFLYIQQNIWVCDSNEERKITLSVTLREQSAAIFSRMRALNESTGLCAVCVPTEGRSTTGLFSVSPTLRWNRTLTYSEQAPSFRPPGERRAEDWVLQKQTKFQMRHSGRMSARVYRNSIPLLHATLENYSQLFPKTIHFFKSSPDKDQKNNCLWKFKGAFSRFFLYIKTPQ